MPADLDGTRDDNVVADAWQRGKALGVCEGRVSRFYAERSATRGGKPLESLELSVMVGDHKSTALIDSGATHCFISKAFA